MKAAKYAAKSATVADLKIAPAVLYALARGDQTFLEVEDRILKAAETERVDMDRAIEIHRAWVLEHPEPEPDPNRWDEKTVEDAAKEEAEAARLQVERARLEAEGRAKARREAAAQAAQAESEDDESDNDESDAEPEPERTVVTKAELMAIVEQISLIRGFTDGHVCRAEMIDVVGCDVELFDALHDAAEKLSSLAYRIVDDRRVSKELDARHRAEREKDEAERKAEQKAARARKRAGRKATQEATKVAA
jgi:hypothetical protein